MAQRRPEGEEAVADTFKVLLLGNNNVGKTSLIQLYATGRTASSLLPTVGMAFHITSVFIILILCTRVTVCYSL